MAVPATVTPASSVSPAPPAPGTNAFASLVNQVSMRKVHPIDAIRAGMPAALLRDASTYFNLPAQRINTIARVPNTTAHNWTRQNVNMDAAASERIWRMADIAAMAREVFGSEEAAKSWLGTANRTFNNSTPLDYLDTEPGAAAVRQVLNAIATGGVA
jgi:putative toxin-antitoxin system antitoxin component (TIGR02293 family)